MEKAGRINRSGQEHSGTRRDQLLTLGDLEAFKEDLFEELKKLLQGKKSDSTKEWLRSSEVRRMLHISPGTLQNFRVKGTLSYTRIGGIYFYKYEDIVRVMEVSSHK